MGGAVHSAVPGCLASSAVRFRVWHFMLLVAYSALAVVDIQDHRSHDPWMIGLAYAGFTGYAVLGWLAWSAARRLEPRLGALPLLALYSAAMGLLFLVATVVYLLVEHVYQVGHL